MLKLNNFYNNMIELDINGCAEINKVVKSVNDEGTITFEDGSMLYMEHVQDCCESVELVDKDDMQCLVGKVLHKIDKLTNSHYDETEDGDASYTWTFFNFYYDGSGCVQARWEGSSNGYYSEDADFFVKNWKD